jgi:rare lipoprotein A
MHDLIEKKYVPDWVINAFVLGGCLAIILTHGCARVRMSPEPGVEKSSYGSKEYPSTGIPSKPYQVAGQWYIPLRTSEGFRQTGVASWYGKDFHGQKTSSGEVYDMYKISAAHKTLPFGTWVRVNNLENNRKIEVRINDRGPFSKERIIDLSYAAAKALGVAGPGTARVHIQALTTTGDKTGTEKDMGISTQASSDSFREHFTVQVGAFNDLYEAKMLKNRLDMSYDNAFISVFENRGNMFYRVRVGMYPTLEQAEKFASILRQNGFNDVFTVSN